MPLVFVLHSTINPSLPSFGAIFIYGGTKTHIVSEMGFLYLKWKLLHLNLFIELLYENNICCTECQPCFFSQMTLQLRKKHNCECDTAQSN